MKKKILRLLIAIVMVLSMAACGSQPASEGANANAAPASTSGKTYTWVMQSHAGTTYENWALYEEFVENVKAATGGRLTIELYQSGSVCEQGDMVTSCQDGILDCMAYSMGNGVGVFGDIAYLMGASGSPAGLNPDGLWLGPLMRVRSSWQRSLISTIWFLPVFRFAPLQSVSACPTP